MTAASGPSVRAYRGAVRDVPALLARVRAAGAPIQLLRADRVCGRDHLRHAAALAARALAEGRARASDLPTETAVYAAGERQIGRALERVGLVEGLAAVAAVAWGPEAEAALDAIAASQGWTRDDALLAPTEAALEGLGVTADERAMVPPGRWEDLALERVALVDVLKA